MNNGADIYWQDSIRDYTFCFLGRFKKRCGFKPQSYHIIIKEPLVAGEDKMWKIPTKELIDELNSWWGSLSLDDKVKLRNYWKYQR